MKLEKALKVLICYILFRRPAATSATTSPPEISRIATEVKNESLVTAGWSSSWSSTFSSLSDEGVAHLFTVTTGSMPPTISSPFNRQMAPALTSTARALTVKDRRGLWRRALIEQFEPQIQRTLEVLSGGASWALVTSPVWGAIFFPNLITIAVAAFIFFWLYRSISLVAYGIIGLRRIRAYSKVDWYDEYCRAKRAGRVEMEWEDLHHIVVVPNYKEKTEKLRQTLEYIANQEYVAQQITVVLAMEEREVGARIKAMQLQREFEGKIGNIFYTIHPDGLAGEARGKSSNEAWAARWAKRRLVDELGHDIRNMTVTSCDADSLFPSSYFSCINYKFATDSRRYRRFWQAPIFLQNNIYRVPMLIRMFSALSTLNFLSDMVKPHKALFNYSTYTASLKMVDEVGYWDVDVIPEDWHMFLKCFFNLQGQVDIDRVYLPISGDAVQSTTYLGSIISRYKQAKRHAWGMTDIPYGIKQCFIHPEIPLWRRVHRMASLMEHHLLWSAHWFILTLGATLPFALPPSMASFLPAGDLRDLARVVLTFCLGPLVIMALMDAWIRPPRPADFSGWKRLSLVIQWFLVPVAGLLFGALPGLESHTRLILGKYIEYRVTEKV